MADKDIKYTSTEDFMTLYTSEERVIFFRRQIGFFNTNEEDVILEAFVEEDRVNMVSLVDSLCPCFYLHLPFIQELRVIIPITMFKVKVLVTSNIAPS